MPRVAASALGALPLAGVVLLAACAVAPRLPAAGSRASAPPAAPATTASRFVHALPDAAFWVTHDDALDWIVAAGARLELTPSGQVLRAAWEEDRSGGGEVIVGSIAAPAAQGGGFVHWTKSRLLRSSSFTGPVELLAAPSEEIRGVRPGLAGLWVITDAGPRELVDGGRRLGPFAEPGLADVVAAGPERAIRLDVFGRAAATFDSGRAWIDLTPFAGIAARGVNADDGELGLETWQGRFVVGPQGKLAPVEASSRVVPAKPFQIAWKGTRADRPASTFDYRELSPLQAAVMSGAAVGDGTAFGVTEGTLARVELATGRLVSASRDGLESGLECQALPADGDVLVACVWNRFQAGGGYLLRSRGGALPVVERAFTEDGTFVADDDGGLGFTGACAVKPRLEDPDDPNGRQDGFEPNLGPTLCVRRAAERPGDAATWIERTVEVPKETTLAAWIPRRDGTATALLIGGAALPDPAGAARAKDQGGVRVVRVDRAVEGFRWKAPGSMQMARDGGRTIDQRFTARADGSIDAWLGPAEEGPTPIWLSVTVARDGTATAHPLPPEVAAMQVTGAFGAAISERGDLFETLDHGRTWRAAGRSPLPPSAASTGGCSALGCALGPLVRLGWGEAAGLTVGVTGVIDPSSAVPSAPLPRILCRPAGSPHPEVPPAPLPAAQQQSIATPWGETLDLGLAHERGAPAAKAPPAPAPPAPAPPPRPAPPAPRGGIFALADKPTHTLLFRPPLAPFAPVKRIDFVAPGFNAQRRALVTPLLDAAGAVSVLLGGDTTELLITGDHITAQPAFETRRSVGFSELGSAGLGLGGGRSLLLGEVRRRLSLEEHGALPPPALFLGFDRESSRRRPLALGRRDDGALGVLVFDGAAPESVAVGPLDPRGAGVLPLVKLAPWSSLASGSDPRCLAADPTAYRALVVFSPIAWLDFARGLTPRPLPGVSLGPKALAEVRWGRDRVCLVAVDTSISHSRRSGDGARTLRLVARWDAKGAAAPNGALRGADYRQDLRCVIAPPEAAR